MILLWTISRLQIAIWMGQSTNVREKATITKHISQHSLQASLAGWAVSYPEVGMVMPSSWDS